jgi:hypothetical protein
VTPIKYPDLKIGDRIRIVAVPENATHSDTKRCFRDLIKRGRSQRVSYIDDDGCPWIWFRFYKRGRWRWEGLGIWDDGSWVKVKKRKK